MKIMIDFELKKFLHNRKNRIIIIIYVLCVSAFLFVSDSLDESIRKNELNIIQSNMNDAESIIEDLEKLQAAEPGLSDKISVSIGINKKAVIVYSDMIRHIRENDRLSLLEDKIALNELYTEIAGEGKGGYDTLQLDAERTVLNYLNYNIQQLGIMSIKI